jgi:iron complex outermembrane receptor protein
VLGARVEGGIDLNGRSGLSALGTQQRFGPDGTRLASSVEESIEDASRRDAALYLALGGRLLPRLLANAGVRFDHVTAENRAGFFGDRRVSRDASSGFASVTAGPFAGTTVTAQVGSGFRDPSLSDRYFRGVSGRGFVTGLPDLMPERSLQYDLAIRRAGRVRTALYLYRYRIRDLVERFRSGDDFFFRNRGRALLRGIELEAQADLGLGVTAELGAQRASGRALDDSTPLADVPPPGLTLTLRRALSDRGDAMLRAQLRGRDEDAGPTEKPVPGYGTLDLGFGWRLREGLLARLALHNLLDHAHPQTADELAALAPGRSAALTLQATF